MTFIEYFAITYFTLCFIVFFISAVDIFLISMAYKKMEPIGNIAIGSGILIAWVATAVIVPFTLIPSLFIKKHKLFLLTPKSDYEKIIARHMRRD